MVDSDYSLNCDIVELAFLLKSVGFQMKSFEFGKNGNAEMKDIEVDIHCKASGFKSKFVLASTKCTCPPKPAENNNSLWEVQGIAPTTPEKKSLVHETACTILPPITKKAAIFARETFQMLLREYRNGIGGYEKSGATTDPKISPRQNEDHSPLNNGNCDVSTKFFSTPLHSTETVQVSSSDNPIMNNIPQIVLQDQNQNDKILLDGQERAVEPLPIKEETGDRIYSPKNVLFQSPSFEKINQESDRDIYVIESIIKARKELESALLFLKCNITRDLSGSSILTTTPRSVTKAMNQEKETISKRRNSAGGSREDFSLPNIRSDVKVLNKFTKPPTKIATSALYSKVKPTIKAKLVLPDTPRPTVDLKQCVEKGIAKSKMLRSASTTNLKVTSQTKTQIPKSKAATTSVKNA